VESLERCRGAWLTGGNLCERRCIFGKSVVRWIDEGFWMQSEDDSLIREMVDTIVREANPDTVILFGSRAVNGGQELPIVGCEG
jgi:hypothetical protein